MPTQSSDADAQVWFLTGSQALYGEETLRQVAEQSQRIVDTLAARLSVPGVTPERFELVASFLSHPRNRRIRAICEVPATDPSAPSLTDVYPGANFGEREVYDLFGITFTGHPDLARILMPDDWVGYPLRKDDAPARVPVTFKEDPRPR